MGSATVLNKAHERRIEEKMDVLSKGSKSFYNVSY